MCKVLSKLASDTSVALLVREQFFYWTNTALIHGQKTNSFGSKKKNFNKKKLF